MSIKIYLYVFFVLLSAFALSGLNIEKFIKKNKILETKALLIILSFALGYIVTNFIMEFIKIA